MTAKILVVTLSVVILLCVGASAQTTEFTYQGSMKDNSAPADGSYDFEFSLFDAVTGGSQLGSTVTRGGVSVANGVFNVSLDFGSQFPGSARFLEIRTRQTGTGAYTTLNPRQPVTSAPYSVKSLTAANAEQLGGVPSIGFLQLTGGTITGSLSVNGTITGNGSGVTNIIGSNIASQSVTSQQLSPESLPNSTAFKLLGSLRWDLLKGQANFPLGSAPTGIVFDGAHIWVGGSNNVSKIRVSDGVNLGSFNVGSQVNKLAFDGANIWVTNAGPSTVTKIRASDGMNLGSFPAGSSPTGIAYDGANLWIASVGTNSVIKIRASDGANLGSFGVGQFPNSVAFDGSSIWVTNNNSGNVTKLKASDGSNQGTFPVTAGGAGARGIAFDGVNMWIAASSNVLTKLRASDGSNQGMFTMPSNTSEVAFDGTNIWVSHNLAGAVTKVRTSDGAILATYAAGNSPVDICFDGANIWVGNSGSINVTRLPPAFPQP